MRRRFLLLLLFACTQTASGQPLSPAVDSLKTAIKKYSGKDTVLLNMLLQLADNTANSEEGLAAARQAALLATSIKDNNRLIRARFLIASHALKLGNDTLSYTALTESLSLAVQTKNEPGQAKALTGIARVFQFRDQYFTAIEYNEKALALYKKIKDSLSIANSNINLGVCYYLLSDYVKATAYYLEAETYYEKAEKWTNAVMALNNLSMVERNLKKYSSAIDYSRKALAIEYTINDSFNIAKSFQGIGITYDKMMKSDSALWYYNLSLGINRRNNFTVNLAENLSNIGTTYKDLNRFGEAYQSLNESVQLFTVLNRKLNMHQAAVNIGELLCTAPDSFFSARTVPLSKRFATAGKIFNNIISFATASGDFDLESKGWMGLSELYKKKGDYKNALDAYHRYVTLQDSVINEEKVELTTRQIDKIEFEKKEARIQAIHQAAIKQHEITRNAIAAATLVLLAGGLVSFFFYKKKRDATQKQKEAELKAEVTETEMKALRAQMNPHFIFNSLNSIGDYIAKHNMKLADEYLVKFAKLMRLILENSAQKEVPLAADLNALELYMQLESLRMNNKFTYEIKVDNEIDSDNTMVPPLLLQPFVENSIWHGIAQKTGNGKITVHISKAGGMIHCSVEDDGIGRKGAALTGNNSSPYEKKSLGMKITKERIDTLNKTKNTHAAIHFSDLAQGTRAEIILPLELNFLDASL